MKMFAHRHFIYTADGADYYATETTPGVTCTVSGPDADHARRIAAEFLGTDPESLTERVAFVVRGRPIREYTTLKESGPC